MWRWKAIYSTPYKEGRKYVVESSKKFESVTLALNDLRLTLPPVFIIHEASIFVDKSGERADKVLGEEW